MFSEGGIYGYKEALSTVNTLNDLSSLMAEKQTEIVETLKQKYYEKVDEIKEWLSESIKPFVSIMSTI